MWAFVPCCSTKKPKQQQIPQPKPILSPQIHADNASQHNTVPNNLDTIMNSAKGKNGPDFGSGQKEPVISIPFMDNQLEWKDTEEEKRFKQSQESLFNLTRDYEVQKTPELNLAEQRQRRKETAEPNIVDMNQSDSMGNNSLYQLTKELNVSAIKRENQETVPIDINNVKDSRDIQKEYDDMEDPNAIEKREVPEENKESNEEKIQQVTRTIADNKRMDASPLSISNVPTSRRVLPVKPLPSLSERWKPFQDGAGGENKIPATAGRDSQMGAYSLRTSDRFRGINLHSKSNKVLSVMSVNQTSVQKLSFLQKSKNKSSFPSHISQAVAKQSLRNYLHQSGEGYSMESNIPGRVNYDSVLNHNLIANHNMILDDSILEAQGASSQGKVIIGESSRIDDHTFPPWNRAIHEDHKSYQMKNAFEDETFQYDMEKLKELYHSNLSIERIKNISDAKIWGEITKKQPGVYQGKSLTCSLISALLTILNFENVKKVKFIENILHPQQDYKFEVNQSGKYGVRLYLNGTKRLVEVDDKVVFRKQKDNNEKIPLGARTNDAKDFWPSLLEKAICKVYSSYDMVLHSVPSIECYRLTGWIPEVIKVSDIANSDHLWQRLFQNAEEDNILISLGTRAFDQTVDRDVIEYQKGHYKDRLSDTILDHAYAVLEIAEVENLKCLKLRNPWGHTPVRPSRLYNFDEFTKKNIYRALKIKPDEVSQEGVCVILWEDIIKFCSTVYLNWTPSVYPYRQTIHSKREIPVMLYDPDSKLWKEDYSLEYSPQFLIKIPPHDEDFEVRIMFERHVDTLKKDNFYSLRYHLFSYKGDRTIFPYESLRSSSWSPREVLSDVFIFEASKETEIYSLTLLSTPTTKKNKYDVKDQAYNFTFEVFSFIEIEVIELPFRKIKQREIIEGKFTEQNTGGNILSPDFLKNPRYVLNVKEKDDFQLKVEGPNESSLMVLAIPTAGMDLQNDIIPRVDFQSFVNNNPGFYFEGFSNYKLQLQPDNYIIMISNQNRKLGSYRLYVDTLSSQLSYKKTDFDKSAPSNTFTISEYKEPALGPLTIELEGEWTEENSRGANRLQTQEFQSFLKNPGYILPITKTTTLRFHLEATDYLRQYQESLESDPEKSQNLEPPSTSVAVFQILENHKFKLVLPDENYAPAAWGFYSREITLYPNKLGYLVICSNYEKGYIGSYKLTIFTQNKIPHIQDSADLMRLTYSLSARGGWSKSNAGGCTSDVTFYKNPTYELTAAEDCEVYIELSSQETHSLCISMVESRGKRLTEFDLEMLSEITTNTLATSELSFLRVHVQKDKKYLLIPSTTKPNQFGKFEIKIEATGRLSLAEKKAPHYKNNHDFSGEFNNRTNMGPFGSSKFMKNPSLTFLVLDPTKFRVHLYTPEEDFPLSIHLFELDENKKPVFKRESGPYTDIAMGCFIEDDIKPNRNGYMLVFSTMGSGKPAEFFIEFSTLRVNDTQVTHMANVSLGSNSY